MTPNVVDLAIQDARWYLNWRFLHYDAHLLDEEIGLVWCHFRENNRKALLALARRGWPPAHRILCKMARFLTEIGDQLPVWLAEYFFATQTWMVEPPKRGQNPLTNLVRDIVIAQTVDMVVDRYSWYRLRPTRNPESTSSESGCSIVMRALESLDVYMTEPNVAKIWAAQRRQDRLESKVVAAQFQRYRREQRSIHSGRGA